MHPFHERLARLGLDAASRYGFALAGGYAIAASGIIDRPSEDVDLFTVKEHSAQFATAVQAVTDAYTADGLRVVNDHQSDDYARLYATDPATGDYSKVDLVVEISRSQRPIQMSIGPVTHIDDAIAAKMGALWTRGEARDLIDVDAALQSGRYTREDLLRFVAAQDRGFDREMFAMMLRRAQTLPDHRFADYGTYGRDLDDMRARFAHWRAELLAG